MFELRWLELDTVDYLRRGEDIPEHAIKSDKKIVMFGGSVPIYRVLQVRHRTNEEEIGIQDPIWSEWQDIPVVEAES